MMSNYLSAIMFLLVLVGLNCILAGVYYLKLSLRGYGSVVGYHITPIGYIFDLLSFYRSNSKGFCKNRYGFKEFLFPYWGNVSDQIKKGFLSSPGSKKGSQYDLFLRGIGLVVGGGLMAYYSWMVLFL